MARKQFNLEEYLAHPEWKVETRDGCPVRIICTDVKRVYDKCLCGLMSMNKGVECPCIWNANGNWFESGAKSAKDLFFVTPEPELSEDERIRKWIIGIINEVRDDEDWCAQPKKCDEAIAWLEKKQKENPDRLTIVEKAKSEKQVILLTESKGDENIYWDTKSEEDAVSLLEKGLKFFGKQKEQTEELSTRLNGLMQEYVKSSKDEEEQEHRLKCYQLFWDALGDSEFFKKEQSPTEPKFKVGDRIKLSTEPKYPFREIVEIKDGFYYFDSAVHLPFKEQDKWEKEQKPMKEIDWTRLTWKDINELERIINNVHYEFPHGIGEESFGKEVLERFRSTKGEDYLDEKVQKPLTTEETELNSVAFLTEIGYTCIPPSKDGVIEKKIDALMKEQKPVEKTIIPINLEALNAEIKRYQQEVWDRDTTISDVARHFYKFGCNSVKPMEWSKEDKEMIDYIMDDIREAKRVYSEDSIRALCDKEIDWLKSLHPQPKQEWSEEDSDMICEIIDHCITIPYIGGTLRLSDERKKELKTFVKSLRPVKQEWSEEDEKMRNLIVAIFKVNHPNGLFKADEIYNTNMLGVHTEEIISWLKSLPERFNLQPKQEWSEEDKKAFDKAINCVRTWEIDYCNGDNSVSERLKSLRPQPHKWYIKKGHWYVCIVNKPEYGWTKGKLYQSPEDNKIETNYGGHLSNWPTDEPWFRPATKEEIPDAPQPHWKPSEEQIIALEKAIIRVNSKEEIPILCELRQQLKKLM